MNEIIETLWNCRLKTKKVRLWYDKIRFIKFSEYLYHQKQKCKKYGLLVTPFPIVLQKHIDYGSFCHVYTIKHIRNKILSFKCMLSVYMNSERFNQAISYLTNLIVELGCPLM